MQISLRPIAANDARTIAALHTASWKVAYRGILPDDFLDSRVDADRIAEWTKRMKELAPSHYGFIAEQDGKPAGFVFLRGAHDPKWGTLLDNLHVRPELRGKRIGNRLMEAAARETMTRHPDLGIYLWVFEANLPSRGFYRSIDGREAEREVRAHPGSSAIAEWRVTWDSPEALLRGALRHKV